MSEFVLDRAENPHPRMLAGALQARARAETNEASWVFWHGYLAAMVDATGCDAEALEAWMDRHQ